MFLDDESENKLPFRTIFISGCARSGTTLVGKILGSALNAEYFMEPPLLGELAASLAGGEIDTEVFENLVKLYIVRDLMHQRLAGRNFNNNSFDDSWVLNYKSDNDVKRILSRTWSEKECHENSKNAICVFKIPDIFVIKPLQDVFSSLVDSVIVKRDPISVYESILRKGWYSNEWLGPYLNGPYKRVKDEAFDSQRVPFWVDSDYEYFLQLNNFDKSALHVISMFKPTTLVENATFVFYENLCQNVSYVERLLEDLSLIKTPQTERVLASIRPTNVYRSKDIVGPLSKEIRKRLEALHIRYIDELNADSLE